MRGSAFRFGVSNRGLKCIFKIMVILLVGVHFYSLKKFGQALTTIEGAKNTIIDEEAISVSPVASNYMIV